MVNADTGELVTDKEGKVLTLADMSKSWYSFKGSRNNAHQIVKRLQKAYQFECDLKKFRPKFITLTFADTVESWQAERAIQKFLNALRTWAKRKCGVKILVYFWTSEVQERGALHYHILVLGAPYISKAQISAWWRYGFVDIRAVDDIGRAFKYLAKYLWKWGKIWDTLEVLDDEVAALPVWWFLFSVYSKRRYGFSKWFQLSAIERIPRWVRQDLAQVGFLDILRKASRAAGGGWRLEFVDDDVGETFAYVVSSPYKVVEQTA
jgi:hypothetical protein